MSRRMSRRFSSAEKQILADMIPTNASVESPVHIQRRHVIIGLCGVAVLTTGIAIGMGISMFCANPLGAYFQLSSSSAIHTIADDSFNNVVARDLLGNTTKTTVGVVTAVRPIKFFGPSISPQLAAAVKAANHVASIEKKDTDDELFDFLEERSTLDTVTGTTTGTATGVWQPSPGLNWTYQLSQVPSSAQLQNAGEYNVWDIDLFDTPTSSIQTIHAAGSKVICYFSGGTDENWRSDSSQFQPSDIGLPMGDWPGENWINTKSSNVRKIMAARLDLAKSKGCDGVDPDNIDAYNHNTGFPLTQSDAVNYVNYLARQATLRGLAISLKNSADIIPKVINVVQYSVEEACSAYSECSLYKPFTDAGKPVFHVEYPKGYGTVNTATVASSSMAAICTCQPTYKFSPIVKNNNLDSWQQQCP